MAGFVCSQANYVIKSIPPDDLELFMFDIWDCRVADVETKLRLSSFTSKQTNQSDVRRQPDVLPHPVYTSGAYVYEAPTPYTYRNRLYWISSCSKVRGKEYNYEYCKALSSVFNYLWGVAALIKW